VIGTKEGYWQLKKAESRGMEPIITEKEVKESQSGRVATKMA